MLTWCYPRFLIPASDGQLTKIAAETSQDPMLNKVIRCLDNEWPKNICKQYYPFRDELSVVNGILLKANRIVVPVSMRNEMLERIHDGHMGTEKSIASTISQAVHIMPKLTAKQKKEFRL